MKFRDVYSNSYYITTKGELCRVQAGVLNKLSMKVQYAEGGLPEVIGCHMLLREATKEEIKAWKV